MLTKPAFVTLLLAVLKYLGLVVAALSAFWGLTHKTYEEENGDRRLTAAGRFAVTLIIGALIVSGAMTYLESRKKHLDELAAIASELRKAGEEASRERRQADDAARLQRGILDDAAAKQREQLAREQLEAIAAAAREQREITREQTYAAAETFRELHNTRNIIVAGQQLNSLSLRWTFYNVPREYQALAEEAKKIVELLPKQNAGEWRFRGYNQIQEGLRRARRLYLLYPWIDVIARNRPDLNARSRWRASALEREQGKKYAGSVMLVPLDESSSSVLPLGGLTYSDETKNIAGSVEFFEEYANWDKFSNPHHKLERKRVSDFNADLEVRGNRFEMSWNIPPGSLSQSIDQVPGKTITTAGFPQELTIIILSNISEFPRDPANFTTERWFINVPRDPSSFYRGQEFLFNSVLVLQPNYLNNYAVTYDMTFRGHQSVINADHYGYKNYSDAAIWHGVRRN